MKREPSPIQDEYAPVIYSQETVSYIEALDMMSGEEDRENILRARATGKAVLTRPFRLLESNHLGVVLTFPVYLSGLPFDATAEERAKATAGYLGGAFEVESPVENLLRQLAGNQEIVVNVYDVTNSCEPLLMYGIHPPDVFGTERTVHVNCDDIIPFCELKPITDTCIVVYMWHLYRKMQEKMLQNFRLVDPVPVEYVPSRNQNKDFIQEQLNKRASYLSSRLSGTPTGQLVIVPCNVGFHWILTIINVEKEINFLLDPLGHRIRDQDWKYVVNMVLKMYNAEAGRKGKKQPTWEVVKAPRQPDAEQCGFYIMRYMKDIIENFGVGGSNDSLPSMFTKLKYSRVEIDEVRLEWAECMLDYI